MSASGSQPSRRRSVAAVLAAALLLSGIGAAADEPLAPAGGSLARALEALRARGLKIVYTTGVVRPEMRVRQAPLSAEPRAALDEILAPHGLEVRDGPSGTLVVVPAAAELAADSPSLPEVWELPVTREEIVVRPSRFSLLRRQPVAQVGLGREEILRLPHLGDDFFRALSLLPGTASTDITAQFYLRGGRRDEVMILLDGQELYDAYHLQDFDRALSVIAPRTLESVDLSTGGYPAPYGDRMSGVLEMDTRSPDRSFLHLGVSLLTAQAGGGGTFRRGRGAWLAQARRGSIDLAGRILGDDEPRYWDLFAKLDHQLGSRGSLRANLLASDDELRIEELIEGEIKTFSTDYGSAYAWLTHQALINPTLFADSSLSWSRTDRDRRGFESEETQLFNILDSRDLKVAGLRQNWNYQAGSRHYVTGGLQLRHFSMEYDYFGLRRFSDPVAQIRTNADDGVTVFRRTFSEEHLSAHLADRWSPAPRLDVELGARFDRHTLTDEALLSPRLNLAYSPDERTVLRLAWGRFTQSQRPYELQVEDGETEFHPVERSEQRILGVERLFEEAGLVLRAEVYQKLVKNPRDRYENLFEPLNAFPEVEPDRVLIAPERAESEGIELFLRSLGEGRLDWWVGYTWSRVRDRISGASVPRQFDQTHALQIDLNYEVGQRWNLNLAWRYHTGWPTTPISVEEVEGEEGSVEVVPVLGPLNSDRLPDYHRLDLRASRRWALGTGELTFFVDVQNVYDRQNLGGFDVEIDEDTGELVLRQERWPGFFPSVGISWER